MFETILNLKNSKAAARLHRREPVTKSKPLSPPLHERPELMAMIERSILIQTIWPEAFDGPSGCCRTSFLDDPRDGYTFVLSRGDGLSRRFSLDLIGYVYQGRNSPGRPMLTSPDVPQSLIDSVLDLTFGSEAA